jgi:hypothetical protein
MMKDIKYLLTLGAWGVLLLKWQQESLLCMITRRYIRFRLTAALYLYEWCWVLSNLISCRQQCCSRLPKIHISLKFQTTYRMMGNFSYSCACNVIKDVAPLQLNCWVTLSLGNAWMHYCSMHGASTGSSLSEPCPVVWKRKNSSIRKHGYHAPTHLIYYGIWFRRLAYVDKSLPNWHIYSFNSHPYSSDAWTVLSLSFHRKKIIICLLWFVLIDLDRWMEIWWLLVVVWTDATWNIAYPWICLSLWSVL